MKTGTHLNSSQAVSAHSLPSRPSLRVRTGQADVLPQLSFKTLFADIKPGAFEEMSKKALALRDEQARIEQARRQQKPRDQDQFHAPAPEPQRSPGMPERARESMPARETSPARELSPASRQAHAGSRTERASGPEAPARQAPDHGSEDRGASVDADRHDAGQADAVAPGHEKTLSAQSTTSATADAGKSPSTDRPAQQVSQQPAATAPEEADSADLPQAVADALAYIEAQNARQGAVAGATRHGQAQPGPVQQAADAGQSLAEPAMTDVPTPADQPSRAADSTVPMVQAAAARTAEPLASTTEASELETGSDMLQAVSATATEMDASSAQTGQGRKDQRGHPAMTMMGQTVAARPAGTANALQAASGTTSTTVQTAAAQATPAVSGEGFSLGMTTAAGRAEATPVGVALPVQTGHSPTRADGSPLISSRIDAGIQTQEFREQFARQVAGLMVQGQDRAEIRLTPAELGPIRIRVSLSADDAQLDISAAHASTRAAIEASMSTLRQMLSEQGIRLAEYRMDNGQNPAFAQNRQSGQDLSSNLQQNGTAFGQGSETGRPGRDGSSGRSTARGGAAADSGSVAGLGKTGGAARGRITTGNGRVDLFA